MTSIHSRDDLTGIQTLYVRTGTNAFVLALLFMPLSPPVSKGAVLEPATVDAWEQYIDAAKKGMQDRLGPGETFLWVDEEPDRLSKVRSGQIIVSPVGRQTPKRVPEGLIHDWVGAVFIPDVTLQDVLRVVRDYPRYKELYQPTVADSKILPSDQSKDCFSMLLVDRSLVGKTALDTEYEVRYKQVDSRRGYSFSRATRILEVEGYGGDAQHVLPEGEGTGLIWRLFSITRYAERDGGVYVEFEAIGLSRDIPVSLRWLVEPMVRRVSRGSLSTSLKQTAQAVHSHTEVPSSKGGADSPNLH